MVATEDASVSPAVFSPVAGESVLSATVKSSVPAAVAAEEAKVSVTAAPAWSCAAPWRPEFVGVVGAALDGGVTVIAGTESCAGDSATLRAESMSTAERQGFAFAGA